MYSDFTYGSTYDSSKTPIAVCVAPGRFFTNGKARWMSLVNMSAITPETGTTSTESEINANPGAGFVWGSNSLDIGELTNYSSIPYYASTGDNEFNDKAMWTSLDDTIYYGIQHNFSDNSEYRKLYDGVYVGYNNGNYGPCLITEDGNRDERLFIEGDTELNAFLDQDGLNNTDILWNNATIGKSGIINKGSTDKGSYPAAVACHRFNAGISSLTGQWYLPAIGELGYVIARLDTINRSLETLGELAVKVGYELLWSSTEISNNYAWILNTYGNINYTDDKAYTDSDYRVRAFLQF